MTKTSICCFRIESHFKERLQAVARKQGFTLSSLVERILRNCLDSPRGKSLLTPIQEERRDCPREEVIFPARWRMIQDEDSIDYDVIIKNISVLGAYAEYMNGQHLQLIKNMSFDLLSLVVRMPGSSKPNTVDCEVRRIHVTEDFIGVGLRFINALNNED